MDGDLYGNAKIVDEKVILSDYYGFERLVLNHNDAVKLVAILMKFIAEGTA